MTEWKLDQTGRQALLRRARAAIAAAIGVDVKSAPAETMPPNYYCAGAFVTLRLQGDLRGCIGYPEPDLPLVEVVERCAVSAALSDPRFPALLPADWPRIDVEISVLGPIEAIAGIVDVEVGRHGLIAELGHLRGLLLPQVAVEWRWNREEFAAHACSKAGLPKDAWQRGAKLYRFEADVFGEDFGLQTSGSGPGPKPGV